MQKQKKTTNLDVCMCIPTYEHVLTHKALHIHMKSQMQSYS